MKSRPRRADAGRLRRGLFINPKFISIQAGTRVYGMVATDRNAGHDEPFVYENATSSFLTVTGITALNTPTSPPTIGDWVPPTLTVVGVMVVITHPGFDGSANMLWGGGSIWGSPYRYWGLGTNYGIIDPDQPERTGTWRARIPRSILTSIPQAVANWRSSVVSGGQSTVEVHGRTNGSADAHQHGRENDRQ